jgi:membrane protein DedA with SNARE-associated domain/rhodanese-related sulfurtransferase
MDLSIAALSQHGYAILFAAVFLEALGLPLPAALALLVAGAAAESGALNVWYALGGSLAAMLAGDVLMFVLGRYTGWWLLGLLCRVSLNPESCILRSADAFYRRGRTLLVVAKFIPGINTLAPPLAGCMNMRLWPFLGLNLAGSALYIGAYFGVGYAFSEALEVITRGYQTFGGMMGWAVMILVAAYLVLQLRQWIKTRAQRAVPYVMPSDAARDVADEATGACIYDVRSHGYFDATATRIKGSRRFDPNALHHSARTFPAGQQVYVYCTCVREATSVLVARELEKQGIRVAVIKGGLRGWKKAGLPLEGVPPDELAALPVFA